MYTIYGESGPRRQSILCFLPRLPTQISEALETQAGMGRVEIRQRQDYRAGAVTSGAGVCHRYPRCDDVCRLLDLCFQP